MRLEGVVPVFPARRRPARTTATLASLALMALLISTLTAGSAPAATTCSSPPEVYPEDQLSDGLTGTGLTTLKGQTPVSFDVSIIGVIPDGIITGLDLIVAQITGPQSFLDQTGGIVYGMSGSPVSIGGKLVGSTSYAWYGDLTIIGITPAEAMVRLFSLPGGGPSSAGAMPSRVPLTSSVRRALASDAGVALDTVPSGLTQMTVPLGVSGLPDSALAKFQSFLDKKHAPFSAYHAAAAPAPSAGSLDPTPIDPGQPFASALSYGDFSVYAIGTATANCGDLTVAYGHPLFYYPPGPTSFGMSDADILTIVKDKSGLFGGFKLGVIGDPHGAIVQDRFAGEVGRVGVSPTTVPITSDFSSPDTDIQRTGETDLAWQERFAVPEWSYFHAWLNIADVFQAIGKGTLDVSWTVNGLREDGSPWTLSNANMDYSDYDATNALYKMVDQLFAIALNRYEDVTFTDVSMSGSVTAGDLESRITRIRTSSAAQPHLRSRTVQKVRKGKPLTIEVTLAPTVGSDATEQVVKVQVVVHARKGLYGIEVRGGKRRSSVDRRAGSFDRLLAELNASESPNELVVSGAARGVFPQDVIVHGKDSFTIEVV
jgi:hypothetical protein